MRKIIVRNGIKARTNRRLVRKGALALSTAMAGFSPFLAGQQWAAASTTATWVTGASGSWSDSTNWGGVVPGTAGDQAQYGVDNTANILLDQNESLGTFTYSGRGPYAVLSDGTHVLTMDNGISPAVISNTNRGVVTMNANLVIGNATGGLKLVETVSTANNNLIINGSITGTGNLTIDPSATTSTDSVIVNGSLGFNGTLTVSGGTTATGTTTALMNIGSQVTKLTKTGVGTLALGSNYSLTAANGSTIGDTTSAMNLSLLTGGKLAVTGGLSAISNKVTVSFAGGEVNYTGTASATSDTFAGLTTAGQGTLTVDASAGGATTLNAGAWGAPAGGAVLFRGTNLGSGQAPGNATVFFSSAPTLSGSGSAGTNTVGILAHAYGDTSTSGTGAGFVTYDAVNGVRLLTANEYATNTYTGAANVQVNAAANVPNAPTTINSLLIASGGSVGTTGSSSALTISSGDILVTGANSGIAAPISLASLGGLNVNTAGGDLTISGSLIANGTNNLVKNGANTLTISGSANSITGSATVNAGTLTIGGGSTNKMVGVAINSGAELKLTTANYFNTGGVMTINSGGTLELNGVSTTTFASYAGTGSIIDTPGGGTLLYSSGNNTTFGGSIAGTNLAVARTSSGISTWTLSGSNSYTGGTYISGNNSPIMAFTQPASLPGYNIAGKVNVSSSTGTLLVFGSSPNIPGWSAQNITDLLSANASNFAAGSVLGIDTSTTNGTLTLSSQITGNLGLSKAGIHTLALGNTTSNYTGVTAVTGGTLSVSALANGGQPSSIGASGSLSTNLQLNGGALQFSGSGNTSTDRLLSVGTATTNVLDASGVGNATLNFSNTGNLGFVTGTTGARTLTLSGSNTGNNILAPVVVDQGSGSLTALTKSGVGLWVLPSTETFSGTTTVSAGTLDVTGQLSPANGGGINAITINGGTLTADSATALNASTFTVSSGGLIVANNTALGSNAGTLSGGALVLATDTPNGVNQTNLSISATSTVVVDKASGAPAIDQTLGTLNFTATGGSLTVSAGSHVTSGVPNLTFGATTFGVTATNTTNGFAPTGVNLSLSSITASPATSKGATLVLDGTSAGNVINGIISNTGAGTFAVTKSNTSTWKLANANTYNAATTITGGVLELANATALPGGIGSAGGTSTLTLNGGVLGLGNGDFSRPLGIAANAVQFTGSGGFAAYGADRNVNLGGSGTPATVTWNSGSFVPTANNFILGASTADHMVTFQNPIALGTQAAKIQVNRGSAAVDATLSGALTGTTASVTLSGNGVLAVTATAGYTGGTVINGGTLLVNNTASSGLGTGSVQVNTGAALGGSGSFTGNLVVNSGSVAPGSLPGVIGGAGTLSGGGTASFASSGALTITIDEGAAKASKLAITGAVTLGGTSTLNLIGVNAGPVTTNTVFTILTGTGLGSSNVFSNAADSSTISDGTNLYTVNYSSTAVTLTDTGLAPEPSSIGLLGFSALGLLGRRRRRESKLTCQAKA